MASILLIETSTALCSAAVETDGNVVASLSSDNYVSEDGVPASERPHASLLAVFCDKVLRQAGIRVADLDAVCVSDGPGSYTGLRVGLSTAKGLCFGGGVKLLSVSSLDVLAKMAADKYESGVKHIVPMIDARRMEVYTALYDASGRRIGNIEAKVVEEGSFADIAADAVFIGDGALKCRDLTEGGIFVDCCPEASAMAPLAEREYAAGNFRDIAYFEPFYLKDFTVTASRKKLF